jgi:hypothetical protein
MYGENVSLYPGNLFLAATQNRNGQMNLSKQTTVIEKTQKTTDEMLEAIIAILNAVMEKHPKYNKRTHSKIYTELKKTF